MIRDTRQLLNIFHRKYGNDITVKRRCIMSQ